VAAEDSLLAFRRDDANVESQEEEGEMRQEYEMTEQQLNTLLEACKPTPVMYLPGGKSMFRSPQENANDAWKALGDEMGFQHMTVRPIPSKGNRFFTAEPNRLAARVKD